MDDDALSRLADRIALEDLVTDYATARDTTDPELYRKIFDADAQICLPAGSCRRVSQRSWRRWSSTSPDPIPVVGPTRDPGPPCGTW